MGREFVDSREGFDVAEYEYYMNDRYQETEVDDLDEYYEDAELEGDDDDDYEDDGQPDEYTEWQDYMGGDDWDHGQYDDCGDY